METLTDKQQLENTQQIRDLFARAHDYIAQSNHPGHLGMKVAEVLNFLAFQYNDFKTRCDTIEKQMASKVDMKAAMQEVANVLGTDSNKAVTESTLEQPKA